MRWKGISLQQLHLRKGEWSYSTEFAVMEAANSLGMTRSAFLALDEEDQAYQMAFLATKSRMRSWESQEQEREIERSRRGAR